MTSPLLQTHFITRNQSLKSAQKTYRERRKKLMSACPFPMVILGVPETISYGKTWLMTREPFYQDPLFFYLTGINQTQTALILNPSSSDKPEYLLLPKKNRHLAFWEGPYLGVGSDKSGTEATTITGIPHCDNIKQLHTIVKEILTTTKSKKIGIFWHESQHHQNTIPDYHHAFKQRIKRWLKSHFSHVKLINIADQQYQQRLPLDPIDIANISHANESTTTVFNAILKTVSSSNTEQDVHATILGETIKQSWMGPSFPPIVASGKNAQILHYHANNAPLEPNGLLLLDMGVRYEGMPSDVSRTIPINGTFNPLQALLYSIILSAQKMTEKKVKPGVTIEALNQYCWNYINEQLDKKIIQKKGIISKEYETSPHNVSHLIGIVVHDGDPNRNYRHQPLQVGMVISNEPGFYGDVSLTIDGHHYQESIGIRIEDNLLVTEKGCRNLTTCPKEIKEIEALVK